MKCFSLASLSIAVLLYQPAFVLAAQPVLMPEKPVAAPVQNSTPLPAPARANTAMPPAAVQSTDSGEYPLVDRMETITFGQAKPKLAIEERLSLLEQAVFRVNYKSDSLFDRTQRLKVAILGANDPADANQDLLDYAMLPPLLNPSSASMPLQEEKAEVTYFEALARNANNHLPVSAESLPEFALEQVNYARSQIGLAPLKLDQLAARMAIEQMQDLRKRKLISHANQHGQNPDLRYTALGGAGAVNESIVSLKADQLADEEKYTRALVARTLKILIDRQDDRDALLSPDATGFGFAVGFLPGERKAVACAEVSTEHGAITPIVIPLKIGDKVDVKGEIEAPYKFFRVSVAWEGLSNNLPAASDETEEALPYFPPLDYVSYSHRAEHDYGTAMTALRIGCLVGVIAGSMFIPPVALAAPLIAMAPGPGEAKPMSDIPLHGGVKISGSTFSGKVTLSKSGKAGIYYLTVWAMSAKSAKPVPISRRAFMVGEQPNTNPQPIANAKTAS